MVSEFTDPKSVSYPKKNQNKTVGGGGRRGKVHISEMKAKLSLSWT